MSKGKSSSDHPRRQGFPLFKHATGRWAKKIRGKFHYFGSVKDDPDGQKALQRWLEVKDYLLAGVEPPSEDAKLPLDKLCNTFLHVKRQAVDSGELSIHTWVDYRNGCQWLLNVFGRAREVSTLTPADFERLRAELASRYSPYRVAKLVQTIRTLFKYAYEAGLIEKPLRLGPTFKRPSAAVFRRLRAERGPRLFTPDEIHALLKASGPHMRAFILLGINAALGPADIGRLEPRHIEKLPDGWGILDFPRPKTGIPRRALLWPETMKAIKLALIMQSRRRGDAAGLLFCTKRGLPWYTSTNSSLSSEFAKVRRKAEIRPELTFYDLRHTFRTVADETRDFPAIDLIMGHADSSMAGVYREKISDQRLRAVSEHVRGWLFGREDRSDD